MTSSRTAWLWIVLLAAFIGSTIPNLAFPDAYIRGGVLLDRPKATRFPDDNCSSADNRRACELGIGDDPLSSLGDFDTMTGLELGLGYAIMPALRLEAAFQYRPEFSFKGQADFSLSGVTDERDVSAELTVLSGMLATYLDIPLPGFGLLRHTPFNPFIGIGGGLSRIEIGDTQMDSQVSRFIVPGDQQVSFSWMVSAGLAVSLAKWTMDVAWRYTDHGSIETATGIARKVCRIAGCRLPDIDLPLAPTLGELKSHGLTLSLRYAF